MDNFNGYPATYQSPYQVNWNYQPTQTAPLYQRNWQQTPVQTYQQQPMSNGIIWVQGESGAKAYVVPNGVTVPLWDSESQTIYIKSVDVNGKPSMTIIDYTERGVKAAKEDDKPKVEYATKEQVDELNKQFSSFNDKLNVLSEYVTKDQLDSLNGHVDDLSNQIDDIENRIMSFWKPQQNNSNSNRRGNNKQ